MVRPGTRSTGPISCSCSLSVIKGRSTSSPVRVDGHRLEYVYEDAQASDRWRTVSNRSRVEANLDFQFRARYDRDGERVMGPLQVPSRLDPQPVGTFLQRGDEGEVLDDHDALEQAACRRGTSLQAWIRESGIASNRRNSTMVACSSRSHGTR